MKTFSYAALTKDNKYVKGEIKNRTQKRAVTQLEKEGLLVINIKAEKNLKWEELRSISTVSRQDKIFFTRHLHSFLDAGISLNKAVEIAAKQVTNPRLKKVLNEIHLKISGGSTLSLALSDYKKIFSSYFINLIKIGEESGTLNDTIKHLLEQQEKEYELISSARAALIYPSVIICAAIGVVVFMMTFVIPTIATVLGDYGGELPIQTKILIAISDFTVDYGLILLPVILALIISLVLYIKKSESARWIFEELLMKFPVVGKILIEYNIARITRALNAPLRSGLSIDRCISLAIDICGNLHFKKSLEACLKFVHKGIPLSEVLKGYPKLYSPNIVGMLEIGENTGRVDHMLERLSEFYEKSVYNTFRNLSSIIEPFLLLGLGLVVGFIAVSVLTPIWKFAETI